MNTPEQTPLTAAVREVFRRGTGSINQVGYDSTGEVTTLTEVRYDLPARRAAIRQRYDLPEGGPGGNGGTTGAEWTEIVVWDDVVWYRSPREETWRVTHAAWPSSSPLKHLYWLLGCRAVAEQPGQTTAYAVDLTADSVLAALDPADQTGISLSLDEAELDNDSETGVHGTVTLGDGCVRTFDFALPGEDGSQYSLAIDAHGRPVEIDRPDLPDER